jgi:hypothetical protein
MKTKIKVKYYHELNAAVFVDVMMDKVKGDVEIVNLNGKKYATYYL